MPRVGAGIKVRNGQKCRISLPQLSRDKSDGVTAPRYPGFPMRFVLALAVLSAAAAPALADSYTHQGLVEPVLHLAGPHQTPTVALTFDACMGRTDPRILGELVDKKIPATIFVTARWLKYNQASFAVLRAHPDLFEIEDHGENHIPAVDRPISIYGIKAAGSAEAIGREVEGGAAAITKAGAPQPKWYRDATAVYSPSAIAEIKALGYRVAGFSVNGDGGSLLGAAASARRIGSARDGDIVIAHINQPTHAAGEGVVKGIETLRAKGFRFVRLADVAEDDEATVKAGG
jgi:peptidoglycan/xylan/chitin deacetylase (PgdA/CDA1 family)